MSQGKISFVTTMMMLLLSSTSKQISKRLLGSVHVNAFTTRIASNRNPFTLSILRRTTPSSSSSSSALSFIHSSTIANANTKTPTTDETETITTSSSKKLTRFQQRKEEFQTKLQQHKYDNSELESFLEEVTSTNDFFASESQFPNFESIGVQSPILLERIRSVLNSDDDDDGDAPPKPSAIQAASYKAIMSGNDITIGAETGSGKTLAYLLPIIDDILKSKNDVLKNNNQDSENDDDDDDFYEDNKTKLNYDYARAVILVPNKELANQVIRMAVPLCGGEKCIIWGPNGERQQSNMNTAFGSPAPSEPEPATDKVDTVPDHEMIRLGFLPGELKEPDDYKPFRLAIGDPRNNPPIDILICTPASLGPWGLNPKNIDVFADIRTLVIDEADMLFDGGYLRQLENALLGFKRADRLDSSLGVKKTQHVLVAATLPDMGTKSVDAYVQKKFPYATRVTMKGMHNARHYGLGEKTVWVEDDYDEMAPKKKRMESLVDILKTTQQPDSDKVGLVGEKVMVFLNNVNDVDSATNALRRSGVEAVPFHAKMPLGARNESLSRFRKFVSGQDNSDSDGVPVLVCTDLAARGLDIPGVTAVVQLQFAGNVVTHLHRMGRCGRAGNRNGRGVIFYGGVESELVHVVRDAEQQQETMVLKGSDIEEVVEGEGNEKGKVQAAFSRKRGFTRKRKKLRKAAREEQENDGGYYD
jgi:superfamily II DNA/RNA helicase